MANPLPTPAQPSRFFTPEELETFERDGVICARGLLDTPTIDHLRDALEEATERILLDNFSLETLSAAVAINRSEGNPPAELEASGGLTIDTIAAVARIGVDYVSVGALTKNVQAIDLSMRIN